MPDVKETASHFQFIEDINDVFVRKKKKLSDFSPEYQERLRNGYRFSGHRYHSDEPFIAPRTNDTMDIV